MTHLQQEIYAVWTHDGRLLPMPGQANHVLALFFFNRLLGSFEPEILEMLRNSRISLSLPCSYKRSVDACEPYTNRRARCGDRPFERNVHGDLHH
jgi:hypothetical protein